MPPTPARCADRHDLYRARRLGRYRCRHCTARLRNPLGGFWWLGWRIRYWWPLSAAWRRACLLMISVWILVALIIANPAPTHAHVRTWRACWQHGTCQR